MKKLLCIILGAILLLVCSACAAEENVAPTPAPVPTATATPAPTASPEPEAVESEPPAAEYVPETFLLEDDELAPDISCEIRVNPRVVFLVDSNADSRVCGVSFANEDAAKILDAVDFLDRPFCEAYAALLAELVDEGYAESGVLEPEISFAEVVSFEGELVTEPIGMDDEAQSAVIELVFYVDAINVMLADSLDAGDDFDPAAAAAEAENAKATAFVERREYTYVVDPVPFDENMYSWRFSMPLENTGDTVMTYQSRRVELRLGGQSGALVRAVDSDLSRWTSRGNPAEIAPGSTYIYNDGYPVEDRSMDYMGYFFTFTDENGKTIEIIYHFNLTFNLPPED